MLSGQQYIVQHTGGINIRSGIGLGKPQLLRGGIAYGTHNNGIFPNTGLYPGGIQVDQHHPPGVFDHHIFRLHIPVDDTKSVQNREGIAYPQKHLPCAGGAVFSGFHHLGGVDAVDVLLQHDLPVLQLQNIVDLRQILAADALQFTIGFQSTGKAPQDQCFSVVLIPQPHYLAAVLPAEHSDQGIGLKDIFYVLPSLHFFSSLKLDIERIMRSDIKHCAISGGFIGTQRRNIIVEYAYN